VDQQESRYIRVCFRHILCSRRDGPLAYTCSRLCQRPVNNRSCYKIPVNHCLTTISWSRHSCEQLRGYLRQRVNTGRTAGIIAARRTCIMQRICTEWCGLASLRFSVLPSAIFIDHFVLHTFGLLYTCVSLYVCSHHSYRKKQLLT